MDYIGTKLLHRVSVHWPHMRDVENMRDWLNLNAGTPAYEREPGNWDWHIHPGDPDLIEVSFSDERIAAWFVMVWGQSL